MRIIGGGQSHLRMPERLVFLTKSFLQSQGRRQDSALISSCRLPHMELASRPTVPVFVRQERVGKGAPHAGRRQTGGAATVPHPSYARSRARERCRAREPPRHCGHGLKGSLPKAHAISKSCRSAWLQFNGGVGVRRPLSCLNSRHFLGFPGTGPGAEGKSKEPGAHLAASGSFHHRRTRRRRQERLVGEAGCDPAPGDRPFPA